MKLRDILKAKGASVQTIGPQATLDDVVDELVRSNIGSLVVCGNASEGGPCQVMGIITERDILRAQAAHRAPLDKLCVGEAMSKDLVTADPQDDVEYAMQLMTYRRVRHLPVLETGQLAGLVSIGDIVKAHHDALVLENHYMQGYIQGNGPGFGALTG